MNPDYFLRIEEEENKQSLAEDFSGGYMVTAETHNKMLNAFHQRREEILAEAAKKIEICRERLARLQEENRNREAEMRGVLKGMEDIFRTLTREF